MEIELSKTERNFLIGWGESASMGSSQGAEGNVVFPEEDALLEALRKHTTGNFNVKSNAFPVLVAWAELNTQPNFGQGAIGNVEEHNLIKKIQGLYKGLNSEGSKNTYTASLQSYPDESDTVAASAVSTGDLVGRSKEKKNPILWFVLGIAGISIVGLAIFLMYPWAENESKGMKAGAEKGIFQVTFIVGTAKKREKLETGYGSWERLLMADKLKTGDSLALGMATSVKLVTAGRIWTLRENKRVELD